MIQVESVKFKFEFLEAVSLEMKMMIFSRIVVTGFLCMSINNLQSLNNRMVPKVLVVCNILHYDDFSDLC